MRKIKICHIITTAELGGAQLSTLRLLQTLSKNKTIDLYLIFGETGPLRSQYLDLENCMTIEIPFLRRKINFLLDLKSFLLIFQLIKKHRFGILHTHCSKASMIGRLAAIFTSTKCCHTYHGFGHDYFSGKILRNLFLVFDKLINRFTSGLIFVCEENYQRALKLGLAKKIQSYVIGDMLGFEKHERPKKKVSNKILTIGSIISFKKQKQPFLLLKLIDKLDQAYQNLEFMIVGDGPLLVLAKVLAKKLRVKNISFPGNINVGPAFFNNIDLFIQTSRYEGLSMAQLEALYYKVPLVVSDKGGIKQILQQNMQGFLYSEGDLDQALKFCKLIIDGKFQYNALSDNYFLKWDQSSIYKDYIKMYKNINRT